MRKWAVRAASFVVLSLVAAGGFFAVVYLLVCEFTRSVVE